MGTQDHMDIEELWRRYAATWSAERVTRGPELALCVSADVSYCDANGILDGPGSLSDYMDTFQASAPGGYFDVHTVIAHHDRSLARWVLRGPAGQPLRTGSSVAESDEAGQFVRITGFFDPEGTGAA
jgi:hypothetical protein